MDHSKRRETEEDMYTKLWPPHTGHMLREPHLSIMSSSYTRQLLDCRSSPLSFVLKEVKISLLKMGRSVSFPAW